MSNNQKCQCKTNEHCQYQCIIIISTFLWSHHSNVIPSFQCHSIISSSVCHYIIIPLSLYHSIVIPSFPGHSIILWSFLCHLIIPISSSHFYFIMSLYHHSISFHHSNSSHHSYVISSFRCSPIISNSFRHQIIIPMPSHPKVISL